MSFSLEDFFFNTPIYTPVIIDPTDNEFRSLYNSYYGGSQIEGYNPWRKIQSTYTQGWMIL